MADGSNEAFLARLQAQIEQREKEKSQNREASDYERIAKLQADLDDANKGRAAANKQAQETSKALREYMAKDEGPNGYRNQLELTQKKLANLQQGQESREQRVENLNKITHEFKRQLQDAYNDLKDERERTKKMQDELDDKQTMMDEMHTRLDEAEAKAWDAEKARHDAQDSMENVNKMIEDQISLFAPGFSPQEYLQRVHELENSRNKRESSVSLADKAAKPAKGARPSIKGNRSVSLHEEIGGIDSANQSETDGEDIADGEPTLTLGNLDPQKPWKKETRDYENTGTDAVAEKPASATTIEPILTMSKLNFAETEPVTPDYPEPAAIVEPTLTMSKTIYTETEPVTPDYPEPAAVVEPTLTMSKPMFASIEPIAADLPKPAKVRKAKPSRLTTNTFAQTPVLTVWDMLKALPLWMKVLLAGLLLAFAYAFTQVLYERSTWLAANDETRRLVNSLKGGNGDFGWVSLLQHGVESLLQIDNSLLG